MLVQPRVMLLGGASQVGFALVSGKGRETVTPYCSEHSRHEGCDGWPRVNLEDSNAIRRLLARQSPDLLIHCGGICDVDKCEAQPEFAWSINVKSVAELLQVLPGSARLVYCSSDHVFGGDRGPYREADACHPISTYGRTRCAAEGLIRRQRPDALIIRHGLAIGPSLSGKSGHLDWLRYRTRQRLPTTVISDEVRSAVWSSDLAARVWALATSELAGVRHVTSTRAVSRLELARYLDDAFGMGVRLTVATRSDQPTPHIGNVELATSHVDRLAAPLRSVMPAPDPCVPP